MFKFIGLTFLLLLSSNAFAHNHDTNTEHNCHGEKQCECEHKSQHSALDEIIHAHESHCDNCGECKDCGGCNKCKEKGCQYQPNKELSFDFSEELKSLDKSQLADTLKLDSIEGKINAMKKHIQQTNQHVQN